MADNTVEMNAPQWSLNFEAIGYDYADDPEKIVGMVTSVCNAGLATEIIFQRKINLGDQVAVDQFIADAKKAKAAKAIPDSIAAKTSVMLARLNE